MPTILVFDPGDDDRCEAVDALQKAEGVKVLRCDDGDTALEKLGEACIDLVVADITHANVNDSRFLRTARREHPSIPIILLTADEYDEEAVVRGFILGAARYLPRGRISRSLVPTVQRVLRLAKAGRRDLRLLECLSETESRFVIRKNERDMIPVLIGYLVDTADEFGLCSERDRLHLALCLDEALMNALIHGNLEINSDVREEDSEEYEALIDERLRTPPYGERTITVSGLFSLEQVEFVIHDEGSGFDPADVPDPTRPENLDRTTGRGVYLMRTFMDDVQYNARGNEVRLVKRRRDTKQVDDGVAAE